MTRFEKKFGVNVILILLFGILLHAVMDIKCEELFIDCTIGLCYNPVMEEACIIYNCSGVPGDNSLCTEPIETFLLKFSLIVEVQI